MRGIYWDSGQVVGSGQGHTLGNTLDLVAGIETGRLGRYSKAGMELSVPLNLEIV